MWFPWSTQLNIPDGISIGTAFFTQLTAERPCTLQCAASFSEKCPFPGEEDLHQIYGFLSPPEPITRTASRSVQPFLYSSRQNVVGHARACYSSRNCFFDWGISTPSNACFLEAHMSPKPKRHLDLFCRFRTAAQCRRTCRGMPFAPQNCPLPKEIRTTIIRGFLGPRDLAAQTVSRSIQSFLHSLRQSVPILYNGPPLTPKTCPFPWGIWAPI